ncbi:enoyl-CoA hydratase/isomerase family protein [Mycolicibacterium komossense]|uniref:3-hydroxyisobutyryl-CoA hydrolase n=1 Tax=Mycolicibacterium komossense TaxID=1779 RepID=A0ABT3C533_9MYCO|nr:enoyl-CoA hydratase/isomerase family protein [Mycolicibacterium komossense]MCV7224585.1 enoyl-CoA hydratase/isomerase family protein [Mycolicibacterium komossense]
MTGAPSETTAQTEILARVDNGIGILTLNRPKAINSLNQTMVDAMTDALKAWEHDDGVRTVLLDGAGERGLCAGGDIVAIYHSARGDGSEARKFWFDEYRLNEMIGRHPKPYVALMDGIVMGGGVGVSAHGNVRVVTDKTKMAMPEVGIGFIPDVGSTFLLPRAPGHLGLHVALTGAPISGSDAIVLGFADHFVPHHELGAFTQAVIDHDVETAVAKHAIEPPPSKLAAQQDWIDYCYAGATVLDILAGLRDHGSGESADAANIIEGRSPIALTVTLEAFRRARELNTLEEVLVQEYRVSCASLRSHDLVEGIRAQLIDKDRNPTWSPVSLTALTPADVEAYFAPAEPDLTFEGERSA